MSGWLMRILEESPTEVMPVTAPSRKYRRVGEGDGRFRPPKGWGTAGVGRWRLATRHSGGSHVTDSAMRLVFGQIAGTALAFWIGKEAPETIRITWGDIQHPLYHGAIAGFLLAIPVTVIALGALSRSRREAPWMATLGLGIGAALGFLVLWIGGEL